MIVDSTPLHTIYVVNLGINRPGEYGFPRYVLVMLHRRCRVGSRFWGYTVIGFFPIKSGTEEGTHSGLGGVERKT